MIRWLLTRARKAVNVVKDIKRFTLNSWDLGVFAWIFNDEGELLLVKTPGGNYSLPGGGVEREDTVHYKEIKSNFPFLEALRREVKEETQIKIIGVDSSTTLQLARRGFFLSNLLILY